MTGKREAALRTPVYTRPGAATEALSKGFAEQHDPTARPAEMPRPTFPPRLVNAKAPGLRPKKVAIEFEPARSSKRRPFAVAAVGSLVLALAALGVTLNFSANTGATSPPRPSADQPQPILASAAASLSEETPNLTPGPGPLEQAQGSPSQAPTSAVPEMRAAAQQGAERPRPAAESTDHGGEMRAANEAPSSLQPPEFQHPSPRTDPAASVSDQGQFRSALTLVEVPPPIQNPGAATRVAALGDMKVVPPPLQSSASDSPGERLMKRALDMIQQGDISGARLILERAVTSGSAQAAFHLAQTYDPRILAKWQARGIKGDAARSRELYRMASEAGVLEAQEHIANLD
jgi:hypothetical protein